MNNQKNTISNGMNIITVIPLQKTIFKEELTYFSAKEIPLGSIVSVMIRNKKVLALVVEVNPLSSMKSNIKDLNFNLRKIIEVKENSIWTKEFLSACIQNSKYFATNKSTGVSALIPNIFKEEYDKIAKIKNHLLLKNENLSNKENKEQSIKTEKLLFQMNKEDRIGIYKTMIRSSFADKASVFIVLPTIHDIDNFYDVLSKGIENFTFKMHTEIKKKTLIENYEKIISGEHPVLILATPIFLSIPRLDIKTIILEQEHSNAYRMIMKPHFDMRTFTEIYAYNIGAKFILADTLLRYETIARKDTDSLNEVYPLSYRINFEGDIKIIGRELNEKKGEKFQIFKKETLEEIEENIIKQKNTFVFSLRKGLATQTICKDCNDIMLCDSCHAPVVLYNSKNNTKKMFVCNRCKKELDSNTPCRLCGSWNLLPLGIGVDNTYEELRDVLKNQTNLTDIKIFKLDKESAKTKNEAEKIIADFENTKGGVLVGTEIALFYLKEKVDLSVISSFDSLWSIPNYKMGERILEIMLSILDRTKSKFIIQTKNNNDSAINAVQSLNLLSFIREELSDRQNLDYPPYKKFIKISYAGEKKEIIEIKKMLEDKFKNYNPEIFAGFVAKSKDKYNINMLITLDNKNWSIKEISGTENIDEKLFNLILSLPPTFNIYVDPENIL